MASPEEQLEEARSWARHGYEIGQRHCCWSDYGVAPQWLTRGWPNSFESCDSIKDEVLPADLLAVVSTYLTEYVSTACSTASACASALEYPEWLDEGVDITPLRGRLEEKATALHARCRLTHKFTGLECQCPCHRAEGAA